MISSKKFELLAAEVTFIASIKFITPQFLGTVGFLFSVEFSKNSKRKYYPIYIRILHNRKKAEGKTSLSPISEYEIVNWDETAQRFKSKDKKYLSYNLFLNAIENEFHNYLRDHRTEMSTKTPHEVVDYLLSRDKPEEQMTILEAINQFYENDILPDVDKAPGTKRNYKKSVNHFSNFLKYTKLDKLI